VYESHNDFLLAIELRKNQNLGGAKALKPLNDSHTPCLSVVIPVYNEEATLARVVSKLLELPRLREIVIVDDCSTDRTPEVARQLAEQHSHVRFALSVGREAL
jgi:cellulose synthase/poly-beta-1,6-N-acetylglucosamine synthase-like glycosyltransferase